MSPLNAYLIFDGTTAEAMRFYEREGYTPFYVTLMKS